MYTYAIIYHVDNGHLDRDRQTLALMNCFLAGIRMNRLGSTRTLSVNDSRPKADDSAMMLTIMSPLHFIRFRSRSRTSSELRFSTSRFDAPDQQLILAAE